MYQMREKEELVPGNIRRYQIGVISGSGFPSAISNPPGSEETGTGPGNFLTPTSVII